MAQTSLTPKDIAIIKRIAQATGIPADAAAGFFMAEGGTKKGGTALAMNPRFLYGMKSRSPAERKKGITRKGKLGSEAARKRQVTSRLRGTLAEKLGSKGDAAYHATAQTVFKEIYAVSPEWAVRCGAWGYFGIIGKYAVGAYGGSYRKFYEAFRSNPHEASIKAAIAWWNHKGNAKKKKHAIERNWPEMTRGYLGVYDPKRNVGLKYAAKLEKWSKIYLAQTGGVAAAAAPARRIALLGDSNSKLMNGLYASHFSGDKILQLKPAVGRPTHWFLALLRALEAKDPSLAMPKQGGKAKAKQLIEFKPEIIHITAMGGNDTSRTLAKKDISQLGEDAKALFEIIKKYNGTVHGPPQARPGAKSAVAGVFRDGEGAAERYSRARAKVGQILKKAAGQVGISFFNPYDSDLGDLNIKGGYATDGIHLEGPMAARHFAGAAKMLGGATSGPGGGTYVGSGLYAPSTGAYDPDDPEGRLAQGEEEMAAKEREKKAAEMRTKAFRKAVEKAFKSQFNKDAQGNIVGPADRSKMDTASFEQDLDRAKSMQRMTADQVVNQAFEEQNAPTPDQLAATVENPDEEIEAPTANGRILKKYVKKLNQHQPDFNFDEFYEEVDVYLKDRSEDLFPKSGRDYVFGDEHWKAFVVVRNLKDKKQAVSESYKFLGNLVKEIKQKW